MRDKEYLKSSVDESCTYSHLGGCSGDIVHHHIRVAGMCGAGMKMGDQYTIPVCANIHHPRCDSRDIPTSDQLQEMVAYWLHRLTKKHGVVKALGMMGEDYAKRLQEE